MPLGRLSFRRPQQQPAVSSQPQPQPRAGRSCAFKCAEVGFDVVSCAISVADIVFDIAVAVEFHRRGQYTFFALSMCIFALAQASYAFLFVATYGGHRSNSYKLVAFLVALPFSQLVPVFTLLESMHLAPISRALSRLGLRPTSSDIDEDGKADSLWSTLQRKYQSHAGFLLEALVEALPQCGLQIAALVLLGDASTLTVLSILLSLSVICSKGWLAAYSLHRPTFVFNSLAIAADVAELFASAAWIAHVVLGDSDVARAAGGWPLGLAHAWLGLCAAEWCWAQWAAMRPSGSRSSTTT